MALTTVRSTGISSLPSISGANLTSLNASNISSGTLSTSRYVQGGITGIDTWGLSSSASHSYGAVTITSNWARRTTHSSSNLGSAMTESSGVFTFPSTGHWLILGFFYFDGNASTHYRGIIMRSGGGQGLVQHYGHGSSSGSNHDHSTVPVHFNMDVTDTTSNDNKIYFQTNSGDSCTCAGGSVGQSYVSFIRLGDT